VHEFGHCFGGLGDEYYSSQISYIDFYPKGVEPWEPNVTAKNTKEALKWKDLLAEGTPVPTPWEKAEYDSLDVVRGKLDRLAPDYYQKRDPIQKRQTEILRKSKYAGVVGAFEGAGYVSKGMYRPALDCRMFTLSLIEFDPVCSAAIERVIGMYVK
ncbi:MAG: M64 family metallopeptidase, partial [Bacteroidetes bacterium]|nr:M64 family metallopeptidase [Bacteroidota bacterium]